jgi:hypothetical protein
LDFKFLEFERINKYGIPIRNAIQKEIPSIEGSSRSLERAAYSN